MVVDRSENSEERRTNRAFYALTLVVVLGFLVSFLLPRPALRKYPNRIPIHFWHGAANKNQVVLERICDRFNESQDKYEVIPLSVRWQSRTVKFILATTGGDPPDILIEGFPIIPKWAESGVLMPLDKLMTPAEKKTFQTDWYPITRKFGMYKGKVYGLVTSENADCLYYRIDDLKAAGLDPNHFPNSMEELVKWGDKLNQRDKNDNLTRLGYLPQGLLSYSVLFGKGFYDWDKGKVLLNTPENLRALTFLKAQVDKIGYRNYLRFLDGLKGGASESSSTGDNWPFMTGQYVITGDGSGRVRDLKEFAPNLKYGCALIPPPVGGRRYASACAGAFILIPANCRQVEGAWKFAKFFSGLENPERAAEFAAWSASLPPCRAMWHAPVYQAFLKEYPQQKIFERMLESENFEPLPPVPYQLKLSDDISKYDELAMRGELTPAQALKGLEASMANELRKRKELGYRDD